MHFNFAEVYHAVVANDPIFFPVLYRARLFSISMIPAAFEENLDSETMLAEIKKN